MTMWVGQLAALPRALQTSLCELGEPKAAVRVGSVLAVCG